MFTYPLEILKSRLQAKIPVLREIDLYMNQDNLKDNDAWIKAAPAVFISFSPVGNVQTLGKKIQSARVTFELMLFTETVYDNGSKRMKKENPKDHMRIFDAINNCIQGYSALLSVLPEFASLSGTPQDQKVMNTINRTGIPLPPQIPLKALMKSVQRFECMMWDHSALINYNVITPAPPLELEVEL